VGEDVEVGEDVKVTAVTATSATSSTTWAGLGQEVLVLQDLRVGLGILGRHAR